MNKNKYTQSVCKHLDDKIGKLQGAFGGKYCQREVLPKRYSFLLAACSRCIQIYLDLKKHDSLLYTVFFFKEWSWMGYVNDLTKERGLLGLLVKVWPKLSKVYYLPVPGEQKRYYWLEEDWQALERQVWKGHQELWKCEVERAGWDLAGQCC